MPRETVEYGVQTGGGGPPTPAGAPLHGAGAGTGEGAPDEIASIAAWAHTAARRIAARLGLTVDDASDLAQESLLAFLSRRERGFRPRNLLAYLRGSLRRLALGVLRSRGRGRLGRLPDLRGQATDPLADRPQKRERSPPDAAIARDLRETAPARFARLPPPCREIAHLRILEDRARGQVADTLRRWRPEVGAHEVRRLWRLTTRMLVALDLEEDPRTLWPGGFSEKNRWRTTPPPP